MSDLIKSDFKENSSNYDKYSRTLTKKYILNGGGSSIEINTASGKIRINKK